MGKSKTTGKGRLDRFYYLAKEQGFRSRAAFKLVQLDRKFQVLSSARSVLDLCAAPGGWMQIAAKNMPVGSLIIGIDLVPIRPIRGAITLQEDITTPQCRAAIKKVLRERQHDMVQVVLHDGSPNVGGAWAKESSAQTALVLDSLKLATEFLAPGGTFITKV
jgi:AdoMet-dependent rRNA methyltransferase SPB1